MTYPNQISEGLDQYSDHFDNIATNNRETLIDLNAINELSELRERFQNASTGEDEHLLETTASTDDNAYLETKERGQYTAGYEAQVGTGIRIPTQPANSEVHKWGYYEVESNDDPLNGFLWGYDATGVYVAEYKGGSQEQKVYQDSWNVDQLDGTGHADYNPSGEELDMAKGNIFQIEFVYYGYGPVEMQVSLDSGTYTVHEFYHDGNTSINNTNLPIRAETQSNGTGSDATDLFVGGRQFSLMGPETSNARRSNHYRPTLSSVGDSEWVPAISVRVKDGTGGTVDFSHVLAEFRSFTAENGSAAMRWQVRRGVTLDTPSWETPDSHEDKQTETALEVDTSATSILDGSSNNTGVFVDGDVIEASSQQTGSIRSEGVDSKITAGEVVSLVFKATSGNSGSINDIVTKFGEWW